MSQNIRSTAADALRVGAIEQADAYLSTHRKSEVWRLIDRLRDELVRASSVIAAIRERNEIDLDTEDDYIEFHQGIRHAATHMQEILDGEATHG